MPSCTFQTIKTDGLRASLEEGALSGRPAPITALSGVGPALAGRLERLGIRTVEDLLFHLPFRYQDRTRIRRIGALRLRAEALVRGTVEHVEQVDRRRRALLVTLSDGTGSLVLRFFHFNGRFARRFRRGMVLLAFGEVREGPSGFEMVHPELEFGAAEPVPGQARLTPVYPATEGLSQRTLQRLVGEALDGLRGGRWALPDWLAEELLPEPFRIALLQALETVHTPPPGEDVTALADGSHPACRRLAFEELLAHQLAMVRLRRLARRHRAPVLACEGLGLAERMLADLPFALTSAQQRVIGEIFADLARPAPMLRLVQGDVGSGKTVVAAAACLRAVGAGFQASVMAPTELLAEQHFKSFAAWMEPLGVRVVRVSGKQAAAQRRAVLEALATGEAAVAVGTHALFQEPVRFARLGLVVVDEQHRFGVHQRLSLRRKGAGDGAVPHQLIMTATPIPRTLAMTAYGDLDYSVIDELPPGRRPVQTVVVPDARRAEVLDRVSRACAAGRQAYWVCTLVEESEALQCQAAEETARQLTESLPQLVVGLVHGRMAPTEKDRTMAAFKAGDIQLLVATTVIEVGVDVPNASLMIIENAERLGLAQLHQLRGRVGRGSERSACVLMYHPPLSELARRRLQAMRETTDGFEIARTDLELRGPGEVLGVRQTGLLNLRIADLLRDRDLLPEVARVASALAGTAPHRTQGLIARWVGEEGLQFAEV